LEFLHEHDIVHGDIKGANILVDSNYRALVADFGLAVVVEESTSRELKGTTRWMAPELMDPERFGFTGESLKQLPSKSTDIYAIGMTILEVLTGCRPFSEINASVTVVCKVMNGGRPDRPPSGFTDPLWDLLAETWLEQHIDQPQKRPPVSTTLDLLKKDVDHWERTIHPIVPKQWEETATTSEGENSCTETPDPLQPVPQTSPSPINRDHEKIVRRIPVLKRIIKNLKKIFGFC